MSHTCSPPLPLHVALPSSAPANLAARRHWPTLWVEGLAEFFRQTRRPEPVRLVRPSRRKGVRSGEEAAPRASEPDSRRSEEHTSELQSLMRISYAVF